MRGVNRSRRAVVTPEFIDVDGSIRFHCRSCGRSSGTSSTTPTWWARTAAADRSCAACPDWLLDKLAAFARHEDMEPEADEDDEAA